MTKESHNGTLMAPVKGTWKTGRDSNLATYSYTPGALYAWLGFRKPGHSVPVRALNPQRASRSNALMLTVALSIPVLRAELVWAEWCVELVWTKRGWLRRSAGSRRHYYFPISWSLIDRLSSQPSGIYGVWVKCLSNLVD